MTPELADHLEQITRELKQGRVIPFLGAGVNLCGFPRNEQDLELWKKNGWLPNGAELSRHLARRIPGGDAFLPLEQMMQQMAR